MSREWIINGMARALWTSAYADWVENMTKEERKAHGDVPVSLQGIDWHRDSPGTPEAAETAAVELAAMFESENDCTLDDLEARAAAAEDGDVDDEEFGHYLAMEALGHGVSWFDDHAKFELEVPSISTDFDGEFFEWSGGCKTSHVNPCDPCGHAGNPRSTLTGPGWSTASQKLAGAAAGTRKNPRGARNPPFVLPVPGQRIRSWDHGSGTLEKICEKGSDGSYTAYIKLADGRRVSVPVQRTEYDFTPRKNLEKRTGFSRHEQFVGPPQPERFPRGTPMEFDDTVVSPKESENPSGLRVLRERWTDNTEIVVERTRHGYAGRLESKRGGGSLPISFGQEPATLHEAMELAKKFLRGTYGRSNPAGMTARGERMYEHIKQSYADDPHAKEIASRTVLARSKDVPGLRRKPR